jgi:glucose-1-phosphate adenylyltransferase
MDGVHIGKGAQVHNAILDKGVVIGDGAHVGSDQARDRQRGYTVSARGITAVGKGVRIDD